MLWDGLQYPPCGLDRSVHLSKNSLVHLYVLEHVEGAYDVELGLERKPTRIKLEEFRRGDSLGGVAQTLQM
jgi:hypothetical protein